MSITSKMSFYLPKSMQDEIRLYVAKDGYGLRGKSKWVSESVERLLTLKNYPELVSYNKEMHGFNKVETVVVDARLKLAIENAILQIRREYPMLEGVKSKIFRTAIIQRTLRR